MPFSLGSASGFVKNSPQFAACSAIAHKSALKIQKLHFMQDKVTPQSPDWPLATCIFWQAKACCRFVFQAPLMRISFIGAGRLASQLAIALAARHTIQHIYSRDLSKAQRLALQVKAHATNDYADLQAACDLIIVAVSDRAIADVIAAVHAHAPEALIVHTSGSTAMQVLTDTHARAGVFYPLQTFSFERSTDWTQTPLLLEAANTADLQDLQRLASELSPRVYHYDSAQRLSLHLAAVFACNFSNYCYDMAKQILDAQNADFALLYPLILETAQKSTQADPKTMQTGPAMRGDTAIINMHQAMLQHSERGDLLNIYQSMSEQILKRHA